MESTVRKVELRRRGAEWAVRVRESDGSGREYQFGSKNQARFFAAVVKLGPRALPPSGRPLRVRMNDGAERF